MIGVPERLVLLAERLQAPVLTADTFGSVSKELAELPWRVSVISQKNQAEAKAEYIRDLDPEGCVAIGNGTNDQAMLKEAALGIAVVQAEGASIEAVLCAGILSRNVIEALDLLLNPLRLTAILRN